MSIIAMKQALENVQEFKRRWWAVPPFGNKVNKATREAVSAAHSPIFQLEDDLRTAIAEAEKQEPVAWKDTTYGNLHHQNFGDCIPLYTIPPAAPVQDDLPAFIAGAFGVSRGTAYDLMREALKDAAPLQEKNT